MALPPPTRMVVPNRISNATHQFLTLDHPDMHEYLPEDQQLIKGLAYDLPITFDLPELLLSDICRHSVSSIQVKHAHRHLPPSLGDDSLPTSNRCMIDNPCIASIRYGIVAEIDVRYSGNLYLDTFTTRFPLQVIPSAPPLYSDIGDFSTPRMPIRSCVSLKAGIVRSTQSSLAMEVNQPQGIYLTAERSGDSREYFHKLELRLHYVAYQTAPQTPPDLGRMDIDINTSTHCDMKGQDNLPCNSGSVANGRTFTYTKTSRISSRTLGQLNWVSTFAHSSQSIRGEQARKSAVILVPMEIPRALLEVPSFHSCLISRVYTMSVIVGVRNFGLKKSLKLCIPLEVHLHPSMQPLASDGDGLSNLCCHMIEGETSEVSG